MPADASVLTEKGLSDDDNQSWMSSYGIITAKRIVDKFGLTVDDRDVLLSLKSKSTFLFKLLRLPFRNMLNDVIRQQIYDYQVYAQKIFIDYLLSGETTKPETSPGGSSRETLEELRQRFVLKCKYFQDLEYKHFHLIANSQRRIILQSKKWQHHLVERILAFKSEFGLTCSKSALMKIVVGALCQVPEAGTQNLLQEAIQSLLTRHKIASISSSAEQGLLEICKLQIADTQTMLTSLEEFDSAILEMYQNVRSLRTEMSAIIVEANRLIRLLPGCAVDAVANKKYQESINFDSHLGD